MFTVGFVFSCKKDIIIVIIIVNVVIIYSIYFMGGLLDFLLYNCSAQFISECRQ